LGAFYETLSIAQHLTELEPENPGSRRDLLDVQLKIGDLYWDSHDFDGAIGKFREALKIAEGLVKEFPKDPQWLRERGKAHFRIGRTLELAGSLLRSAQERGEEFDSAEAELGAAQTDQEALVKASPNDSSLQSNLSATRARLAALLVDRGKPSEAEEVLLTAVRLQERLVNADPSNQMSKDFLAPKYSDLSRLYDKLIKPDEARIYAQRAFDLRKELWNLDHSDAKRSADFASTAVALGDHQAAVDQLETYRQALAIWRAMSKSDSALAQLEKSYEEVIKAADAFASQQDWTDAKNTYGVAQTIARLNLNDNGADIDWQNHFRDASNRAAETERQLKNQAAPTR
jgi:tetratricopeptide (TPR) repeat protein